ncbi:hypothetical protein KGV55_02945 [Candidatus Gracilibacteria bacterium]|nr:hypothetical protein [Candidatus Gracilibacteria bacterium]
MKNNINTNNYLSIKEQRDKLLELNPDLIYGVYELIENNSREIKLKLVENFMTCYPNQLENIEIPSYCNDINIINIGALRKGKIENLKGNGKLDKKNIILVSGGVIEYYISNTGKKHIVNTFLRDNETSADGEKYTTPAGRCTGKDLQEEAEREYFEEAPFLGVYKNGDYYLAIPNGNENGKNYTKESIELFLKRKYTLDPKNKEDLKYIKIFERNFKPIKYKELGNILEEIVKNNRFVYYKTKNGVIPEINSDIKNIKIGKNNLKAYCFFDKDNNTLEYRKIIEIVEQIKDFKLLSRLYLEGKCQKIKAPTLENVGENVVPILLHFSKTVNSKI